MSKATKKSSSSTPAPIASNNDTVAHAVPAAVQSVSHRQALEAMLPKIALVPKESFLSNRVDVERSATTALARARMLHGLLSPSLRAQLAAGKISTTIVDDTILAAQACLELVSLERTADALSSEATLEPALLEEATQRKSRMLKLVSYYFEADPAFGFEIADIRQGSGHIDLASDLKRLAALYENGDVAPIVTKDPKFYDPHDAPRARILAESIYDRVGESRNKAEQERSKQVAQAWVLLNESWDQVRRVVAFLFFDDKDLVAKFASLYTFGRVASSSTKGSTDTQPVESPDEPTEPEAHPAPIATPAAHPAAPAL